MLRNSGVPSLKALSSRDIVHEAGISERMAFALKSSEKPVSVDVARKLADLTGGKPGNVYLASRLASLKSEVEKVQVTPKGILTRIATTVEKLKEFSPDEVERDDEFLKAIEELRDAAQEVVEMIGEDDEDDEEEEKPQKKPTAAKKSASKSATTLIERDSSGCRVDDENPVGVALKALDGDIHDGWPVERDASGCRI